MGLLNWLRGDQERQREAEADRVRQVQIDTQREAAQERVAAKVQQAAQIELDREQAGRDRQREPGPAERAFREHADEIRAEIRGDRQQEPEKQPEREATRHEHQFNPIKQAPTMGMSGVTYVNRRAVSQPEPEKVNQVEPVTPTQEAAPGQSQQRPRRTVAEMLAAGERRMQEEREKSMIPEQQREQTVRERELRLDERER